MRMRGVKGGDFIDTPHLKKIKDIYKLQQTFLIVLILVECF